MSDIGVPGMDGASYKLSAAPTAGQHHLFGHRIGADRKLAGLAKTPRLMPPARAGFAP